MSGIFTKVRSLPTQFPLVRGMISYAIIWPTCSVVQEYIENGTTIDNADFARAARFGIFGTFFMAPVFYGWMKYTSRFFKSTSLKTAVLRAAIEQISYSPLAMAYFFFGMSLLELKPVKACVNEVKEKFWPTYKIGAIFWPTAQTLNFYFISEKNRIIFVSAASFVWTVYLAHMKAKDQQNAPPKIMSRPGLNSSVNLSGEVVNISGERIITSGEIVKTPGEILNTSGETINTSGEILNISGETINTSGDILNISGDTINTSGEILNISGDTINTSGDIVNISGETITTSGEIVKIPGEILNKSDELDSMVTEVDKKPDAVDKSLVQVVEASSTEMPADKVIS